MGKDDEKKPDEKKPDEKKDDEKKDGESKSGMEVASQASDIKPPAKRMSVSAIGQKDLDNMTEADLAMIREAERAAAGDDSDIESSVSLTVQNKIKEKLQKAEEEATSEDSDIERN